MLDGVIARELIVADHVSAELLGPGDLIRPWQAAPRASCCPSTPWSVLFAAPWPCSTAASRPRRRTTPRSPPRCSTASCERSLRLATTQAISQLTRVDRRLKALFWHLAERWGRVSAATACDPARAHPPHPRPARGRAPADGLDRAEPSSPSATSWCAAPTARGCCAAIRPTRRRSSAVLARRARRRPDAPRAALRARGPRAAVPRSGSGALRRRCAARARAAARRPRRRAAGSRPRAAAHPVEQLEQRVAGGAPRRPARARSRIRVASMIGTPRPMSSQPGGVGCSRARQVSVRRGAHGAHGHPTGRAPSSSPSSARRRAPARRRRCRRRGASSSVAASR